MSSCEKCWRDSARFDDDHAAAYSALISERASNPCTPEEQAGEHATECTKCHRMTIHQWTGEPMCGCPTNQGEKP